MAHGDTATTTLINNVRLAIFQAGVTRSSVAASLNMSRRTFYRRLADGQFTVTEIQRIADLTGKQFFDLLPTETKAAS